MADKNAEKSYHAQVARKKVIRYIVLVFLAIICLFPFYVLIINSTHFTDQIQSGKLLLLPGTYFAKNFVNTMQDGTIPLFRSLLNSILIAIGCAVCTTYF